MQQAKIALLSIAHPDYQVDIAEREAAEGERVLRAAEPPEPRRRLIGSSASRKTLITGHGRRERSLTATAGNCEAPSTACHQTGPVANHEAGRSVEVAGESVAVPSDVTGITQRGNDDEARSRLSRITSRTTRSSRRSPV